MDHLLASRIDSRVLGLIGTFSLVLYLSATCISHTQLVCFLYPPCTVPLNWVSREEHPSRKGCRADGEGLQSCSSGLKVKHFVSRIMKL